MMDTFKIVKKDSEAFLDELNEQGKQIREFVYTLVQIPSPQGAIQVFGEEKLDSIIESLVESQRNDVPGLKAGSWCMLEDVKGMPGDARVEFIFLPTYYITCILSHYHRLFPEKTTSKRYHSVLKRALNFCAYRNFAAHGIELNDGYEIIPLFYKSGVFDLVFKKDYSEILKETIQQFVLECDQRVQKQNFADGWNGDIGSLITEVASYKTEVEDSLVWYFAYGSNMDIKRLEERVGKVKSACHGCLTNYELVFNKKGNHGERYANIRETQRERKEVVEGVLYKLTKEQIARLDSCEGFKPDRKKSQNHYTRKEMRVTALLNKGRITVSAYVYVAENPQFISETNNTPSQEYLGHLLEGKVYLSKAYYSKLEGFKNHGE